MKTKEVIRLLQEVDPSGELEVSVGNEDIYFIYSEEGYWDGCQTILKRNYKNNIIGAEIKAKGTKIVIDSLSIQDVLFDNFDLPITYDSEYSKKNYEQTIEEYREESINLHKKMRKLLVSEFLPKIIDKINNGWKIVQPLYKEPGIYNTMWFLRKEPENIVWYKSERERNRNEDFKILCQGDCEAVIELGCFKPVYKEKYVEWERINEL